MKGWYFVAAIAFTVGLLLYGINAWSRLETITCDRGDRVRCTVVMDAWMSADTTTYPDVRKIEMLDLYRGWWGLTLTDARGNESDVVKEVPKADGQRVVSWFASGDAHVEASRDRYPWHLALLNLMFLGMIGMFGWGYWHERAQNRVDRKRLGID